MFDAYDGELRKLAKSTCKQLGLDCVHEGIYCMQVGPCYESVSECRMMQILGADVAGEILECLLPI